MIGQIKNFMDEDHRVSIETISAQFDVSVGIVHTFIREESGQWHFHHYNAPVHNSILITDYLTKMAIKTVPQPLYNSDLTSCDFCFFPKFKEKLRGYRYETIEEMKEAVMKVIVTLTRENFHGVFQKVLERYKYIAAGGDYFEGD